MLTPPTIFLYFIDHILASLLHVDQDWNGLSDAIAHSVPFLNQIKMK
jgi:hypothetical protein